MNRKVSKLPLLVVPAAGYVAFDQLHWLVNHLDNVAAAIAAVGVGVAAWTGRRAFGKGTAPAPVQPTTEPVGLTPPPVQPSALPPSWPADMGTVWDAYRQGAADAAQAARPPLRAEQVRPIDQ